MTGYYKGTINGKYEFIMQIVKNKDRCEGSYYYKTSKKYIPIYGSCDAKSFTLEEHGREVRKAETRLSKFVGIENNGNMDGTWLSADGSRVYKFHAAKVIPNKRELLGDAKGEYYLATISGFYGANSMADIWRENGKWIANGSSISAGMREGYSFDLTKNDKRILSSFKILVDDDLAVNIISEKVVIAKFPYSEQSIFRVKNISREEDSINRIYKYAEYGNFQDNNLHIATSDEFNFSEYIAFESTPIDPVHALVVDYSSEGFRVEILDKVCCGGTTLTFVKK
jgi:hypothetical protein